MPSFGSRGFAARAQVSLRKFAARAWMEITFRIDTLLISQDRSVLAQVIFRPTKATVLARNLVRAWQGGSYRSEREFPRCLCSQVCERTVLCAIAEVGSCVERAFGRAC